MVEKTEGQALSITDQKKLLPCPRCSRWWRNIIMKKITHPTGAILDVCRCCGGMWLDSNEVVLLSNNGGKKQ